ncbi:MAG: hypothetical protein UY09_C0002G0002 [Parcubacteria group bacterium GW2011_GWA2_47_8]|nr:MAG: hypothetical protein UY09_C0002G0002 [Parcubacteria group bacterium GW2011_GWA2_47_8]
MNRVIALIGLLVCAGLGFAAAYFFITSLDPSALDFIGFLFFYLSILASMFGVIGFFYTLIAGRGQSRLPVVLRRTFLLACLVVGLLAFQQGRTLTILTGALFFGMIVFVDLALAGSHEHE